MPRRSAVVWESWMVHWACAYGTVAAVAQRSTAAQMRQVMRRSVADVLAHSPKGPGLKPLFSGRMIQRPEGRCSLRRRASLDLKDKSRFPSGMTNKKIKQQQRAGLEVQRVGIAAGC